MENKVKEVKGIKDTKPNKSISYAIKATSQHIETMREIAGEENYNAMKSLHKTIAENFIRKELGI